ncbi:Cytosine deaminase [Burkholderiales bacterium 8X]|nr:Cytosine deaminase [Burkholderiales bacterium 8X]
MHDTMPTPSRLDHARLPGWLLPADWPTRGGEPSTAQIDLAGGRVQGLRPSPPPSPLSPSSPSSPRPGSTWDLNGALVLPGFVDAHTHLDKSFTLPRMSNVQPGLLGAIDAMLQDRARWTADDVLQRASRGLGWAFDAGTVRLRTHVDWWEPEGVPVAWPVMAELAAAWRGRIVLEQVALIKLPLFEDLEQARSLARRIRATGPHALLGGFVHSTIWSESALRHLLLAAQECELDIDLHVDEELNPQAIGLATVARIASEIGFEGRIVCGHCCALSAQPYEVALATLDAVARAPITLVSLPATNLLLQDAVTGRTPTRRGITLVKEARERGIPLLYASDNVQDPFCRLGSFDPVEAMGTAVLAAQLAAPFDLASESLCRGDWLQRGLQCARAPSLVGSAADFVIFTDADVHGWPSRSAGRMVLRNGAPIRAIGPAFFSSSTPYRNLSCSTATSHPTASCPT